MSMAMEKFKIFLKAQHHLNLGTVTPANTPVVSTVAYASDENSVVYFLTEKKTRKAQNILKNNNVAYTIDEDTLEWNKTQSIQMTGKASILEKKEEIEKAGKLLMTKFPAFASMPQSPDVEIVFIKVEPVEAIFGDNTISFGHRDVLTF